MVKDDCSKFFNILTTLIKIYLILKCLQHRKDHCSVKYFTLLFVGCRIKVHRDHLDRKEDSIAPCKLHYDPNSAKELLVLAATIDDQKLWTQRLGKKIQKCGYKANSGMDGAKVSPR